MTKDQFLTAVRQRLAGLDASNVDRFIDYYSEIIDDRMEDGLSEAEAVAAMGTPEYVASQILMDTPLPKLVRARSRTSSGPTGWQLALILLGSPVWLTLLLAAAIVLFAGAVTVSALIFSMVVTVFALGVTGIGCVVTMFCFGFTARSLLMGAAGLILIGISILLFLAFVWLTKALVRLCRWAGRKLKFWFVKKGDSNETIR